MIKQIAPSHENGFRPRPSDVQPFSEGSVPSPNEDGILLQRNDQIISPLVRDLLLDEGGEL